MTSSASSHGHEPSYLSAHKGWKSWLFTLDHKRIGVMYLAAVIFGFALGGLFAMLLRLELIAPNHGITEMLKGVFGDTSGSTTYNKLFTLHGAVMIFLFIIPSVPAALGNFVLPLMLGAKDVAFPRLNLLSFHIYVLGTLFFVAALLNGGIDTGWTFYAPYSIRSNSAVVWAVSGAFILGFSSILTGLNFIATIHAMRPPQMTWFRMPLFLWALYATACIQVLATPVLAITLVLIGMEQIMNVGIFDPALGGDAVLMQHFFWFYSHPAVYIMI
ncbi:MAG: cbb3-type cytochrome c oxidase subunit I, partial [Planctomycetota bacterium]